MMLGHKQKLANIHFAHLSNAKHPSERVGRPERAFGVETLVIQEITRIGNITNRRAILDIGSGCGVIAKELVELAHDNSIDLTLMDIQPVLEKLRQDIPDDQRNSFTGILGNFPNHWLDTQKKYDLIIAYSVLHYASSPLDFVMKCVSLLTADGILIIGDIPNLDKLRRFRTVNGEDARRPKLLSRILGKNAFDGLTERQLLKLVRRVRGNGFEAYLYPQNPSLPHSGSREDLVIFLPSILKDNN